LGISMVTSNSTPIPRCRVGNDSSEGYRVKDKVA
jgi:hypothetical protein